MNYSIFKSRTFWVAVVLAVYNVLVAVAGLSASVWITDVVNVLGVVLVTYFHVNPSQSYTGN